MERGLPYMTSAQRGEGGVRKYPKFADKQYIKFKQGGGGAGVVKESENFADIINVEVA